LPGVPAELAGKPGVRSPKTSKFSANWIAIAVAGAGKRLNTTAHFAIVRRDGIAG
jgi:hypothetical protein